MIDEAWVSDAHLFELLSTHPRVRSVIRDDSAGIRFRQGEWMRSVSIGRLEPEVKGLVELIDNNPLVCADDAGVPDPASTLALIAVGPIALAGILTEAPTMIVNVPADEERVSGFLQTAGWSEGITLHADPQEGIAVAAATVIASIQTPSSWDEIDELYDERFERSFFVHRVDGEKWDSSLVEGKPNALYHLRYTPGEDTSLLTIQVMGDLRAKCGPSQAIHAMNVMAGFEESLGLA